MNDLLKYLDFIFSIAKIAALFITYFLAVKQFRMNKSSNYLERFLGREFIAIRENVDSWLADPTPPSERISNLKTEDGLHTKAQLVAFSNFFQELGVAYKHNLVDHNYIKAVFEFLLINYWDKLKFWIECYREEKGRSTLFADWENLSLNLKTKK